MNVFVRKNYLRIIVLAVLVVLFIAAAQGMESKDFVITLLRSLSVGSLTFLVASGFSLIFGFRRPRARFFVKFRACLPNTCLNSGASTSDNLTLYKEGPLFTINVSPSCTATTCPVNGASAGVAAVNHSDIKEITSFIGTSSIAIPLLLVVRFNGRPLFPESPKFTFKGVIYIFQSIIKKLILHV